MPSEPEQDWTGYAFKLEKYSKQLEAELAAKDMQIQLLNELAAARSALIDELIARIPPKQEEAV